MASGCAKPRVRESDFNWKATTNIRGICCARRLPPNFDGGRAPLWTSRYFISCGRPFRWNEHREREKEGRVSKRRSEKIRVVFEQVSLPSSSQYPTPGAIEQPATWLTVSQTIVQMFANRL